jgi:predicted nucleic acid-binding Zn ribbon protein
MANRRRKKENMIFLIILLASLALWMAAMYFMLVST